MFVVTLGRDRANRQACAKPQADDDPYERALSCCRPDCHGQERLLPGEGAVVNSKSSGNPDSVRLRISTAAGGHVEKLADFITGNQGCRCRRLSTSPVLSRMICGRQCPLDPTAASTAADCPRRASTCRSVAGVEPLGFGVDFGADFALVAFAFALDFDDALADCVLRRSLLPQEKSA